MKYVLDTNAVSALMKGDAHVVERLKRLPRADVVIPQPVIAEIAYGIARLGRSKKRDVLVSRFELVRTELGRVAWSEEVSEAYGAIKAELERKGERIEDFDVAVAAHALAHAWVLVTANTKHLARVSGLEIEDWSEEGAEPSR